MRRIVLGAFMGAIAACSSERVSAAPQPQKSALLGCRVQAGAPCEPKPLLMIDGKRANWDDSGDLNPSDIETVEVLKGQAALKLYGDAGRHGVVQVTTRKSKP